MADAPSERHLPGDTVTGTDPLAFSLEFVGRMRKRAGLANIPSLRTAIAIPRYLTARLFRKGALVPQDYLDAAVVNTPFEDQNAAYGSPAKSCSRLSRRRARRCGRCRRVRSPVARRRTPRSRSSTISLD